VTTRPYPDNLEEQIELLDGRSVILRPIRPDDEDDHYDFLSRLTPEDVRFRFFGKIGRLSKAQMYGLTHIDYDLQMAFIASELHDDGSHETLGVVRTIAEEDFSNAEFAIVVRSDLKELHLGWSLLTKMIEYCRSRGIKEVIGQVMPDNARMLRFCKDLGFTTHYIHEERIVEVTLRL